MSFSQQQQPMYQVAQGATSPLSSPGSSQGVMSPLQVHIGTGCVPTMPVVSPQLQYQQVPQLQYHHPQAQQPAPNAQYVMAHPGMHTAPLPVMQHQQLPPANAPQMSPYASSSSTCLTPPHTHAPNVVLSPTLTPSLPPVVATSRSAPKGRCPECKRLMQPGAAVCSCKASVPPQTFKRATSATTRATRLADEADEHRSEDGSDSVKSDGSEARLTRADADVAMERLRCLTGCADEHNAARSVIQYVQANPGCLTQCAELCADISSHLCKRDGVKPENLHFRSDLLRQCQAYFQDFLRTPTKGGTLILSLMASLYVIGFVGTRTILSTMQALKDLCPKVGKNQRKLVSTLLKDMLHRTSPAITRRGTPDQAEQASALLASMMK